MRVINRTAITIVGAQPYIKWTLQKEADFNKGTLTVARAFTDEGDRRTILEGARKFYLAAAQR